MYEINGQTYQNEKDAKKEIARLARLKRKEVAELRKREKAARHDALSSFHWTIHHLGLMAEGKRDDWVVRDCAPTSHIPFAGHIEWEEHYSTQGGFGKFYHYGDGCKPIKKIDAVWGTVAVQVEYETTHKREWLAVGVSDGEVCFVGFPAFLTARINRIGAPTKETED
jgi:hypothetical protein